MKKILLAVCAIAVVSLAGCKKDNNDPSDEPGGGGTQYPTGEGIYIPSQKIATISVDGELSETWSWDDWKLDYIVSESDEGSMSTFHYNDYRLSSASSELMGMPVSLTYNYAGNKLASISAGDMAEIFVTHNASGKIDSLKVDMDNEMVNALLNLLLGYMNNGGAKDFGRKVTVNNTDISMALDWQGDNVSRVIANAQIEGSATLGEIRSVINIDSLAGSAGAFLSLLGDTTNVPLVVQYNSTSEYNHDTHNNPFCGFYGRLDPSMFSAANITQETTSGNVTITATLSIPFIGNLSLPYSYPIESSTTNTSYTYNNAGYPLTATDDEGVETTYSYK